MCDAYRWVLWNLLKYLFNHPSIYPGREGWSSVPWEPVSSCHSQLCQACSPPHLWQVAPSPSLSHLPEKRVSPPPWADRVDYTSPSLKFSKLFKLYTKFLVSSGRIQQHSDFTSWQWSIYQPPAGKHRLEASVLVCINSLLAIRE